MRKPSKKDCHPNKCFFVIICAVSIFHIETARPECPFSDAGIFAIMKAKVSMERGEDHHFPSSKRNLDWDFDIKPIPRVAKIKVRRRLEVLLHHH